MGNKVVHFDLNTADNEGLAKFYADLFGWHTESRPEMNYVVIDTHAGRGINGGFAKTDDPASTVFYVEVDDLQKTLDNISSLGGKTETPPTEIPNVVTFAIFNDPAGNRVGLAQRAPETPGQGVSKGSNPPVTWFEAVGKDGKALKDFYSKAFDWKLQDADMEGIVYGMVDAKDTGIGGGIGSSQDGSSKVVLYAEVDDLQKYLDKAAGLGGKTVMEPATVSPNTSIALFLDPQGNTFGLFKVS